MSSNTHAKQSLLDRASPEYRAAVGGSPLPAKQLGHSGQHVQFRAYGAGIIKIPGSHERVLRFPVDAGKCVEIKLCASVADALMQDLFRTRDLRTHRLSSQPSDDTRQRSVNTATRPSGVSGASHPLSQ